MTPELNEDLDTLEPIARAVLRLSRPERHALLAILAVLEAEADGLPEGVARLKGVKDHGD